MSTYNINDLYPRHYKQIFTDLLLISFIIFSGYLLYVNFESIKNNWLTITIIIIITMILGLAPKLIGRKSMAKRIIAAKEKEKSHWGFHGRIRRGPWLYYVEEPVVVKIENFKGRPFQSNWVEIKEDGMVIINPGKVKVYPDKEHNQAVEYDYSRHRTYAWDGNSPKIWMGFLFLIGTPDWWDIQETYLTLDEQGNVIEKEAHFPITSLPSLVHDVLYQYLGRHDISKKEIDQLYKLMLMHKSRNFLLASLYYRAVSLFGGRDDAKQ